jgi:hypothetical protein
MTTPAVPEFVPYSRFKERRDQLQAVREFTRSMGVSTQALDEGVAVAAEEPSAHPPVAKVRGPDDR